MGTTTDTPLFSIITPVYAPQPDVLRTTIASVVAQTEQSWELILVDDASPDDAVRETLRAAARDDARIQVVERPENGHIVAASNDGVALARGEFVALLDHDDLLAPDALEAMAEAIAGAPDVDYLYSDEDKVDDAGRHYDRFAKPDWSPERLRGQMYTGHFSVLRTALVREVGGFHEGFDGSQDHDLALRVTERARRVLHVPRVLYHWRAVDGSTAQAGEAKPYAWDAGVRAVQAHMDRLGLPATVERGRVMGTYRLRRPVDPNTLISVVIPTRGSRALVWGEWRCLVTDAVRSLLAHAGHEHLEIVVVHDEATPPEVLRELRALAGPRLRLVAYDKAFNFSEKCNLGALASSGQVLVFLNDDLEIISDDFLVDLCAPLVETDVGMTGARLSFADTTVQHAGLAFHRRHFSHAYKGRTIDDPAPFNALVVNRECSGLTAACVAMTRPTFDAVGGFSESLPNNFNDVDLSYKITWLGRRVLWVASAHAYHFESKTRVPAVRVWEHRFILDRWGAQRLDPYLDRDRAYDPEGPGTSRHRAIALD